MFRVLRAGDDLQAKRKHIIYELNTKLQFLKIDATIVFDAQYHYGETSRTYFKHLEIIFSAEGESADDLIVKELKSKQIPSEYTVVTSDKKLSWRVRRKQAKTVTVEKFLEWLNRRYKNELRKLKSSKTEQEFKIIEKFGTAKPPTPSKKPDVKASPAECFDYYLEVFEKNLQEQIGSEIKYNIAQEPLKLKKKSHISDMQRWLNAFEENPESK